MKLIEANELEFKWLDFLLMSVRDTTWKSIFEVRERFDEIIPPHLIYRKAPQYCRGRKSTILALKLTELGGAIRYAMKAGFVDRSVPISPGFPRNIGNYQIRLTPKGKDRLKRIRRYLCTKCLHSGITRPKKLKNAICGHCHSRHLTYY